MAKRNICLILWTTAIIAAGIFYTLFDPETTGWMPKCPVYFFTGLECPGCGSQRAIHSLLKADFVSAFEANALFVGSLPFLAFVGFVEYNRKKFPVLFRKISHPAIFAVIICIIAGWTVYRNLS